MPALVCTQPGQPAQGLPVPRLQAHRREQLAFRLRLATQMGEQVAGQGVGEGAAGMVVLGGFAGLQRRREVGPAQRVDVGCPLGRRAAIG